MTPERQCTPHACSNCSWNVLIRESANLQELAPETGAWHYNAERERESWAASCEACRTPPLQLHMTSNPNSTSLLTLQDATGPEEEQPQGVEMEDDFEGELQDVPEGERQEQEDEEGEEGDEERLDQQMGDGGEGEQVCIHFCFVFHVRISHSVLVSTNQSGPFTLVKQSRDFE